MSTIWDRMRKRVATPRTGSSATATTDELRMRLPILWPDGPEGRLDAAALRSLSRHYARTGRHLQDLLDDLDALCDVVGISASSRVIETSTVAWSDAFLDTVAAPETQSELGPEAIREVERRILAHSSATWTNLPGGHLLVVTFAPHREDSDLGAFVAEVRALFPDAAVVEQPELDRVVAAVTDAPDLPRRISRLEAFGAEHLATAPTITTRQVPAELDSARRDLREVG